MAMPAFADDEVDAEVPEVEQALPSEDGQAEPDVLPPSEDATAEPVEEDLGEPVEAPALRDKEPHEEGVGSRAYC